jgi:hypothetical protein
MGVSSNHKAALAISGLTPEQQQAASDSLVAADQPKMPKYDYQKDDTRTFSVGCSEETAKSPSTPHSRNGTLKIF